MNFSGFLPWAKALVFSSGYLGMFLVNLLGSATVFIPIPIGILVFFFGALLNPWLVGLAASLGAALGELVGYFLGYAGGKIWEKSDSRFLNRARDWFNKGRGEFWLVVLFALSPLPDDFLGVLAGILSYGWKKYALGVFLGKLIMNLALAWAGFYGIHWLLNFFKLSF